MIYLQGLGLVLTFGPSTPGVQATVMTLLCICFGFLHCIMVPLKDSSAQHLQTTLLLCLTLLALASTPFANALELQVRRSPLPSPLPTVGWAQEASAKPS